MASNTGRSCGTVGMETGMMDFVTCPVSGKEVNTLHRSTAAIKSACTAHELKTTLRSLICGSRPKTPPTELLQYRQRQTVGSSAGRGLVSAAAEVEFSAA